MSLRLGRLADDPDELKSIMQNKQERENIHMISTWEKFSPSHADPRKIEVLEAIKDTTPPEEHYVIFNLRMGRAALLE